MAKMICFSIHPTIRNKPPQWQPTFASGWIQKNGTLQDLRNHVTSGDAFIAAAMTSDHRTAAAFSRASLAAVDIDNGLTIEEFRAHPLAEHAAFVYTTASHKPEAGSHRFRVIFRLPEEITNPELYKNIVTILTRALGGDKSCTDPTRLFYGCDSAHVPLWEPDHVLPQTFICDAEQVQQRKKSTYDESAPEVDESSILKAIFVLEQVIQPTRDGERELFIRTSAGAKAGGDALFPSWSDWSSRGHHGSGSRAHQSTQRFFDGLRGSSLGTLFFLASEADPDWRNKLPDELKAMSHSTRGRTDTYAGYSWEDFMGDASVPVNTEAAYGLFESDAAWAKVATPAAPTCLTSSANASGYTDADFMGDPVITPPPGAPPATPAKNGPGRPRSNKPDPLATIKARLKNLYPGLRLNLASGKLEFGPKDNPCNIPDSSTTYIRVSYGTGEIYSKAAVADLMQIIGFENKYNPVTNYLDSCLANQAPCPYFDKLATTLIGLSDDPFENPTMPNNQKLADVIMRRMFIGAVARAFKPGCDMDWVPIFVGPQNLGKSAFFRYIVPEPREGQDSWSVTLQQGITMIKEKPHMLHCGWIVVLDEIERYFKRNYVEELKNLVSVSKDLSAKKWQNESIYHRSFILAGATNSRDFLQDPTGNRRFMPILAKGVVPSQEDPRIKIIDLDRLKRDRDSIWAAAYQAYMEGESWQFSSYEVTSIKSFTQTFTIDNSIDQQVEQELTRTRTGVYQGQSYIRLADLFHAMGVDVTQQNSLRIAVTDALKKLGYTLKRISLYNKATRVWLAPVSGQDSSRQDF
jgi:hypothetical protein